MRKESRDECHGCVFIKDSGIRGVQLLRFRGVHSQWAKSSLTCHGCVFIVHLLKTLGCVQLLRGFFRLLSFFYIDLYTSNEPNHLSHVTGGCLLEAGIKLAESNYRRVITGDYRRMMEPINHHHNQSPMRRIDISACGHCFVERLCGSVCVKKLTSD